MLRSIIWLIAVTACVLFTGSQLSSGRKGGVAEASTICPADVNGSTVVDSLDLLTVALHYGSSGDPAYDPRYDMNNNGAIDSIDLLKVALAYGGCPELFGPPTPFSAGTWAHSVVIADLNGDTKNDLVTADAGANTMSVLIGNGDGTFAAAVSYATGSQPKSVVLGDLNGDAKLDAVSSNQGTSNVSVLLGNGNGTFGAKTDIAACTNTHESTLALLNADAFLDIACAGWGASQMRVLLGNGNGTFAAAVTYTAGSAPHSIAAADFNADGKLDLATANHGSANISVFIGSGTGTFAAHVAYAAGGNGPHSIRAGDLNGDGDPDLVTANNQSDNIGIFYGNPGAGVGTFQPVVSITVGNTPKGVAIADMNGDTKLDIFTANIDDNYPSLINPGGDSISVLFSYGNGTFEPRADYAVGQAPFAVAAGRLNGDTKLDIVTANWWDNGVTVRLNTLP